MRRAALLLALAAIGACQTAQVEQGLVVVLYSDGKLGTDFDSVRLSVNGEPVDTSGVTALPTSIAVKGTAGMEVRIEARGIRNNLLRVGAARQTTIPNGRAAVIGIKLALDCYDRCTQLPPNGTLVEVCDPDTLPHVATTQPCVPPLKVPVDTLPTILPTDDPTTAFAVLPTGCGDTSYCKGLTCNAVAGPGATGSVACDGSCRSIDTAKSTCVNPAIQSSSWATIGGAVVHQQRSALVGPLVNPQIASIPFGSLARGISGTPVVSADGHYAYVTQAAGAFNAGTLIRVDLVAKTAVALPMPLASEVSALLGTLNPVSVPGGLKCCEFYAAPTLAKDGSLIAVASSGVFVAWAHPEANDPPQLGWIFRDWISERQAVNDLTPVACYTEGLCVRSNLALSSDGTAYVGTREGLFAFDAITRVPKWGPVTACESEWSNVTIGPEGRMFIGRVPNDGICSLTNEGIFRTFEAKDGVFGLVNGTPSVGVDGTVYFATTNYKLYARSPTLAWEVPLDGPAFSGPAVGPDGTIYILTLSPEPTIVAVDPIGRFKWRRTLRGSTDVNQAPTVATDGTIYVANSGGFLDAIGPNGVLLWEIGNGDPFQGSPVITADKTILASHVDRLDIITEAK